MSAANIVGKAYMQASVQVNTASANILQNLRNVFACCKICPTVALQRGAACYQCDVMPGLSKTLNWSSTCRSHHQSSPLSLGASCGQALTHAPNSNITMTGPAQAVLLLQAFDRARAVPAKAPGRPREPARSGSPIGSLQRRTHLQPCRNGYQPAPLVQPT